MYAVFINYLIIFSFSDFEYNKLFFAKEFNIQELWYNANFIEFSYH